jgi:hypothetical protein
MTVFMNGDGRPAVTRLRVEAPRQPVRPADVHLPAAEQVPDWSPETGALLADLTALERAVVEWAACGHSGAESYRRATGRDCRSARQAANQIMSRPRVAAALQAALRDRNFMARMDREWLLGRLFSLVEECEKSGTTRAGRRLIDALRLAARLQGLLPGCRS